MDDLGVDGQDEFIDCIGDVLDTGGGQLHLNEGVDRRGGEVPRTRSALDGIQNLLHGGQVGVDVFVEGLHVWSANTDCLGWGSGRFDELGSPLPRYCSYCHTVFYKEHR